MTVTVRPLRAADLPAVVRIDARHSGRTARPYWERVLPAFLRARGEGVRVGLAAESGGKLAGYLLGEVRAFEFGSEPCGWIFAVGIEPRLSRAGIASRLLEEACARFRAAGIARVRTMVRRGDVPVLAFFRANGFAGGSFLQLERDLKETA